MILLEEARSFGIFVIEFELVNEIKSSTDDNLPSLLNEIEIMLKSFKGGDVTLINKLTSRTVLGDIGDSRISSLILEAGYKNFDAAKIKQFYIHLKDKIKEKKGIDSIKLYTRVKPNNEKPQAGILVVTVIFSGYSANMQNDTRKSLRETFVNKVVKMSSITIQPITWSIIRRELVGKETTVGGQMKYAVKNITESILEKIQKEAFNNKPKIWDNVEIEFETTIWGLD